MLNMNSVKETDCEKIKTTKIEKLNDDLAFFLLIYKKELMAEHSKLKHFSKQ